MNQEEQRAYGRAYQKRTAQNKAYYAAHKEEILAYKKAYHKEHLEEWRAYKIKFKYGISLKEFDSLLESQNGACAVCHEKPTGKRRFHIDHDHNTGKVRGLLCHKCNCALGFLKEDVTIIENLKEYILKHKEKQ